MPNSNTENLAIIKPRDVMLSSYRTVGQNIELSFVRWQDNIFAYWLVWQFDVIKYRVIKFVQQYL